MIKSLANSLSYSLATFATAGITSGQLYPLFWRVVAYLEMTCALKVVASTADGASPNRKFFRIHKVNICLIFIPNYYLMLLYLQIISQGFFILRKTGHACWIGKNKVQQNMTMKIEPWYFQIWNTTPPKYHVILGRGLVENKWFYFSIRTLPDHMQLVTKKASFVIVGSKLFRIWINGPYYRVSHNLLHIPYPLTPWLFLEMHYWRPLPSKYEAPSEKWTPHLPTPTTLL